MSTYYTFICTECKRSGGFYSRQMWGWGNANIIETFKFLMRHSDCFDPITYEIAIKVVDEHDHRRRYDWFPHSKEELEEFFPHTEEWGFEGNIKDFDYPEGYKSYMRSLTHIRKEIINHLRRKVNNAR